MVLVIRPYWSGH